MFILFLFSLGLIHANHGSGITNYIAKELRNNSNEVKPVYVSNKIPILYMLKQL